MKFFKTKEEKRKISIAEFWKWFSINSDSYRDVKKFDSALVKAFVSRLSGIHRELVFQFDPNYEPAILEISADGIKANFPLVREVVEAAPKFKAG